MASTTSSWPGPSSTTVQLLIQLACDHLRAERVVRPAIDPLMRRVAAARERAWAETYERLQPLLFDPARRAELDGLLDPDPTLGAAPLVWLRTGATAANAQAIRTELVKLAFVRSLGADHLDLSVIPVGRRQFLAGLGRRSRTQALARAVPSRRYPVLLATLSEAAVEILDDLVELFDQALAGADRRARDRLRERALARLQVVEDRLDLLDELVAVLTDPTVADEDVGALLRRSIGAERLSAAPGLVESGTCETAVTLSSSRLAAPTCASSPPLVAAQNWLLRGPTRLTGEAEREAFTCRALHSPGGQLGASGLPPLDDPL